MGTRRDDYSASMRLYERNVRVFMAQKLVRATAVATGAENTSFRFRNSEKKLTEENSIANRGGFPDKYLPQYEK